MLIWSEKYASSSKRINMLIKMILDGNEKLICEFELDFKHFNKMK